MRENTIRKTYECAVLARAQEIALTFIIFNMISLSSAAFSRDLPRANPVHGNLACRGTLERGSTHGEKPYGP